ncbi:MAG TPA: ATP-binding protein [Longimicrobiales bacterium]|nr:ATP-binding protein [Longimicrobiales bacterium]
MFDASNPGFEQLRRLTGISRALTYTTSLDQVTHLTVERGAELLDAAAAVLMLTDADGLLQVSAAHGVNDTRLARFHAPLTDDLIRRLQGLLAAPVDRFLAVPLVVGGEVTGLVGVSMNREATAADEWLLSALADQAAVALENARLSDAVQAEMGERVRARDDASARDRALSTLAHDIRTPLGAIEGYCGILEAGIYGDINDRQRETLGRIRMSGRHLLSLLDNVMDMARLNAGVVRVAAEPVRVTEVVREALEMLLPAAGARLQTLGLGELRDVVVSADHDRLRQVLVNLVGNAVKFTPEDGTITISTAETAVDGAPFGEIRVTDNGPGIPLAEQAAIFEPYYRSEITSSTAGVGLGLAISQGLIAQMGGTLTLDSEPDVGSTFIVRLPC